MKIFVIGSSILSSYWNGAATYYRGIYKSLALQGHSISFAEPDAHGRQQHRDAGDFSYVTSLIYEPGRDLDKVAHFAAQADVVIKHSGVGADDVWLEEHVPDFNPNQVSIFWDVDAPATLHRLRTCPQDPFHNDIPRYDGIFTYGGGSSIRTAYSLLGARSYSTIYNGLDPQTHYRVQNEPQFSCDLAFLGNRLPDREQRVDDLFLEAAHLACNKSFLLGGEGWSDKNIPSNVKWIGHVPTALHNALNSSATMVLNINRQSMADVGFAPPTRVFEAAGAMACLLCDEWPGIQSFFVPQRELVVIKNAADVVHALRHLSPQDCRRIGQSFHEHALSEHTYAQRALGVLAAFEQCKLNKQALTTLGRA